MVFLMTYAKGALMTPWHDLRFSLMVFIILAISDLLIFGSMLGSFYSSLGFFWPAMRCTVSSFTPIISQSKVHLHLWLKRKTASFRFSWAITETCCPLLDILSAFLPPGFLTTLQMSLTFLSVRTQSLSGLFSPCSLMSNLAALGLNPSRTYISWIHKVIISGPHALCTHRIPMYMSWCIILWWRVPVLGNSIFAYSASGSTFLYSWATCSSSGSDPS